MSRWGETGVPRGNHLTLLLNPLLNLLGRKNADFRYSKSKSLTDDFQILIWFKNHEIGNERNELSLQIMTPI